MRRVLSRIELKFRRWLLVGAIRCVRSCFTDSNELLKQELSRLDFGIGLRQHPSILWVYGEGSTNRISIINKYTLLLIRYLVTHYTFYAQKDRDAFKRLRLHEYFVNDISHLMGNQNRLYVPYQIKPRSLKNERIVIYTVITGLYDDVHELLWKEDGVDYILFTDNRSITSRTWNVHYIEEPLSPILLSRKIKMLPHIYLDSKYTASIYVDAVVNIYGHISELVSFLNSETSFVLTVHENGCVRKEMDVLVNAKKCRREEADTQYAKYVSRGFGDDLGLGECTILIRYHNDLLLRQLMELWYSEFCNGIHRDQISLMPCIYMMQYKQYRLVKGSVWHNQYCNSFGAHQKK